MPKYKRVLLKLSGEALAGEKHFGLCEETIGAITDKTIRVINHFSHNADPIQHKLEARVKDIGYIVAYDGMTIEL